MIERILKIEVPCPAFLVLVGERALRFACSKKKGHQSKHKTLGQLTYTLPSGLRVMIEHPVEWTEAL